MHTLPRNPRFDAKLAQAQEGLAAALASGNVPSYAVFVDRLFKQIAQVNVSDVIGMLREMAVSHEGAGPLVDVNALSGRLVDIADSNPNGSVMHAAVGCAGEGGEMLDCAKKVWIYGKTWDQVDAKTNQTPLENLLEEMGDFRFYYQKLLNMLGITDEDVQAANHDKLRVRYSTGVYSDAQAQARVDKVVASHLGDKSATATPTRAYMGKPQPQQQQQAHPQRRKADAEEAARLAAEQGDKS